MSIKKGSIIVLLFWAISECFNNERLGQDIWKDPTFSIFICLGDLTLLLWMWGVSISVWRRTGIDYIKLLSLEHTDLASSCHGQYTSAIAEKNVFENATDLSLVYLATFIIFNKALRGSFSMSGEPAAAHAIPSCLLLFFAIRFFFPYENSRQVYLKMLWKVLAAPYYPVKFGDGYVGDLLTSLVRVSISLSFSCIYIAVEIFSWLTNDLEAVESVKMSPWWQRSYLYRFQLIPFLTLLPLWLRFMQCIRRSLETGKRWPHLYNAMKYACAMMVFSFGVLHPALQKNLVWITCLICATCYQFVWDITMDWGLVQFDKKGQAFVRKERSLGKPWVYKVIVFANFLLRFAWAITYVPREIHKYSPVYNYIFNNFQTVMAAAEIIRRMVWGFLRLEWEHIEKTGSAPISLSMRKGLEKEFAALKSLKKSRVQHEARSSILLFDTENGIEMEKMQIGSTQHSKTTRSVSSFSSSLDIDSEVHVSVSVSERDSGGGDVLWSSSDSSAVQEDDEWTSFIALDYYFYFPFFLFKDLKKSVSVFPRSRFNARVLEALMLTIFVLGVMSVSAVAKLKEAGYI